MSGQGAAGEPVGSDHGWARWVWLVYLGALFLQPLTEHQGLAHWALAVGATLAFLVLYFAHYRAAGTPWARRAVLAIALLGVALLPWNGGATAFFIFAAALFPFCASATAAFTYLVVQAAVVALECTWLRLPPEALIATVTFSTVVGASNVFFAQRKRQDAKLRMAQDEIEALAKIAERERIARDLHDVLGHTLSLVALKAELARRLLPVQPDRAAVEIADIEQVARKALSDVREAIGGYRAQGLAAEVERAKLTLKAAGIRVQCDLEPAALAPAHETVLSLVLREAVTNIVRHSGAASCRVALRSDEAGCALEVEDDGRGTGQRAEGNGLRGMRERVEGLGGSYRLAQEKGTKLAITLPATERRGAA